VLSVVNLILVDPLVEGTTLNVCCSSCVGNDLSVAS